MRKYGFWLVLPLLAAYVGLRARAVFVLDEDRFVLYARNLLDGFYAPPDTLFLWNGPGYPLLLAPFVFLGINLLWAKLLNALFLAGAWLYLGLTLRLYVPRRQVAPTVWVAGLYLAVFDAPWLHLLMTETLAAFLVAGFAFHFCAWQTRPWNIPGGMLPSAARKHALAASLYLGYLALTKFFFGYVIAFMLVGSLAAWLGASILGRARGAPRPRPQGPPRARLRGSLFPRGALVCALALAVCLPYLAYTWRLTGKIFYWGNTGGSQLYTLTLPEDHLLGDVVPVNWAVGYPEFFPSEHAFLKRIESWNEVDRDIAFRAEAWRNIHAHPGKFLRNWRANVNRLAFDHPYTRFPWAQSGTRTGNLSFVTAPAFFLFLFCLYPVLRNRSAFPGEAFWLLAFAAVSLGGLSLLSAYARFVFPLLPILALGAGLTFHLALDFRFRGNPPPGRAA